MKKKLSTVIVFVCALAVLAGVQAKAETEGQVEFKGKTGTIGFGILLCFKTNNLKIFSVDNVAPNIGNIQKGRYKIYSTFAFV